MPWARETPYIWGSRLIFLQQPRSPLSISGASCYYLTTLLRHHAYTEHSRSVQYSFNAIAKYQKNLCPPSIFNLDNMLKNETLIFHFYI